MLNSTLKIHPITPVVLPPVQQSVLDNGLPVAVINVDAQELCFISLAFHAGRSQENSLLSARASTHMMREGTLQWNSTQLSEQLDYYGSHLSIESDMDYIKINLFCLNKHLNNVLPILNSILIEPTFPEDELNRYKQRAEEKLKEQLKQTEIVSYRELTELLYGNDHPYGYNSTRSMIQNIQRPQIVDHFSKRICAKNGVAVISGHVTHDVLNLITKYLNEIPKGQKIMTPSWTINNTQTGQYRLSMESAIQTSIRKGKKLFDKQHEDYDGVYLLNMLLGGYFGSRLSQKIREEMGLVYGIYSHIDTLKYDGIFYINTETSHENVKVTHEAIKNEIDRIKQYKISSSELERAKNYLLGQVLNMVNGTFELSQTILHSLLENHPPERIIERINHVKSLDESQILQLAQKYLAGDEWTDVFVGG